MGDQHSFRAAVLISSFGFSVCNYSKTCRTLAMRNGKVCGSPTRDEVASLNARAVIAQRLTRGMRQECDQERKIALPDNV